MSALLSISFPLMTSGAAQGNDPLIAFEKSD